LPIKMKLQIACALLGAVAMMGTPHGVVGDEGLEGLEESDHARALLGVEMDTHGAVEDDEDEDEDNDGDDDDDGDDADEDDADWWEETDWTRKMYLRFECDTLFDESERPIPSAETWMRIRQAYVDVVGISKSSIGEPNQVDGFFAPIEVRQSPGRGRGVFAAEDIPRGQHIHRKSIQMAQFDNGIDFKKFLDSFSGEGIVCDIIEHAYLNIFGDDKENEDNLRICVELDNASLMNSIDQEDYPVDVGCLPEWNDRSPGGCDDNKYALRDIKKGDEILMDYDEYPFEDHWGLFGLEEKDDEEKDKDDGSCTTHSGETNTE
jgi:hypothetical protein